MTVNSATSSSAAGATSAASAISSLAGTSASDQQDRFLKLLVTQMKNQDPLSPMDNAQLTSQIAQINTVSGISTLNTSVQGLATQLVQMQALEGASLVGKDVIVAGNSLSVADGVGQGGYDITGAADNVKIDVVNTAGQVVDTMNLGAQTSGSHSFDWAAKSGYDATSGLTFKVTATTGSTTLSATPLMRDKIDSVTTSGTSLVLQLDKSGNVNYSDVKAFN